MEMKINLPFSQLIIIHRDTWRKLELTYIPLLLIYDSYLTTAHTPQIPQQTPQYTPHHNTPTPPTLTWRTPSPAVRARTVWQTGSAGTWACCPLWVVCHQPPPPSTRHTTTRGTWATILMMYHIMVLSYCCHVLLWLYLYSDCKDAQRQGSVI